MGLHVFLKLLDKAGTGVKAWQLVGSCLLLAAIAKILDSCMMAAFLMVVTQNQ